MKNLNLNEYQRIQEATLKQLKNQDDSAKIFINKVQTLLKIKNL